MAGNGISKRYLYFTVFVAGMSTLAVEFTTSRMLQTVYGTSNIVWANVIGLVLLFLTLGYFLGGRLADRRPNPLLFYYIVTVAGFCSVFFLLLTSAILRSAASAMTALQLGAIVSSLIGVVLALALPVTLLGFVSPFAIRLGVSDVGESGRVSGLIYAVSTWGSLLGTYLPVLLVIPQAGTRFAAIIFGLALMLVGLGGIWQIRRDHITPTIMLPILLVPSIIALTRGGLKSYEGQIYETESAYNYIQVIRRDKCNYLLLNEGQAFHSYYCDGNQIPRISVWSLMIAAPFFRVPDTNMEPHRVAIIGLAAGTVAKQYIRAFGPISIDGIELDGKVIDVGRRFFAMNEANINAIVGDGRYELNQLPGSYDVITLDAYKVPYIPWHLTTREFFQEVKDQLNDNGVLAVNVGRAPRDRRLVEAISATLLTVFSDVHTVDVRGSLNSILYATVQPTKKENLKQNLETLDVLSTPYVRDVLETAVNNLVETTPSEVIFTDSRAPVETMVDSMVLRYLLSEGPAGLPGLGG